MTTDSPIKFSVSGHECLIDTVDADLLELNWYHCRNKGSNIDYLQRSIPHSTIQMQRVIMGRIMGRPLLYSEKVDHWDRNGLNNTRSNLRLASHSQNLANSATNKNNLLGVKGVTQLGKKFMARCKGEYIGLFPTVEQAHAAYLEAARATYGEFANDGTTTESANS